MLFCNNTLDMYLESTVFNHVFSTDKPNMMSAANYLLSLVRDGKINAFTSEYAVAELKEAKMPKREKMLNILDDYEITVLPKNFEAERLANIYIVARLLTENHRLYAIHIAMTTVMGLQYIVSYDLRHIARKSTVSLCSIINGLCGYPIIGIISPTEVEKYGDSIHRIERGS
jgi:radical SAM superfamily enzyme